MAEGIHWLRCKLVGLVARLHVAAREAGLPVGKFWGGGKKNGQFAQSPRGRGKLETKYFSTSGVRGGLVWVWFRPLSVTKSPRSLGGDPKGASSAVGVHCRREWAPCREMAMIPTFKAPTPHRAPSTAAPDRLQTHHG